MRVRARAQSGPGETRRGKKGALGGGERLEEGALAIAIAIAEGARQDAAEARRGAETGPLALAAETGRCGEEAAALSLTSLQVAG